MTATAKNQKGNNNGDSKQIPSSLRLARDSIN